MAALLLFYPFEATDGKRSPTETFAGRHCSGKAAIATPESLGKMSNLDILGSIADRSPFTVSFPIRLKY